MSDPVYSSSVNDSTRERRKIIIRAGISGALVVTLLATLLIFGHPKEDADADLNTAGNHVDIGLAVNSSSPVIPAEVQKAIAEAPDTAQAALESAPEAAKPSAVSAPVEGSMDPSVKPILNTPPSASKSPAEHPVRETHADRLVVDAGRTSAPVQSVTIVPVVPPGAAVGPVSTVAMVPPTPALPSGSFAVQLGVFSNVTNAQDLQAKLKQAGIPAQLETRVQVGPFLNKEEAMRAQDKLRVLGLGKGMLVVAGKKS
jgi:cell division septation protein DedD